MPIAAVPVIRSVQRRRGRKEKKYQDPELPAVAIQEEVDIGQIIEENRDLPKIQGILSKEYLSGPFGLLGDASQPQFFELDPERASLFYWETDEKIGPPKKKLPLMYLEEVDANVHHRLLFLRFRGLSLMQLRAETTEDFNDWLEMLSKYRRPTDEAVKTLADRIRAQRLKGKSLAPDDSAELGSAVDKMFSNKKERKSRSRDRSGRRHEQQQQQQQQANEPNQSLATSMSKKASLRVSANRTHRSKRMTGRNSDNQRPSSDSPHRNSSDEEHHRRRSSRTSSEERWLRKAAENENNQANGSADEQAQQNEVNNDHWREDFQIPQSWLDQEIMEDLDDYVPPMSPEQEAAARLQQERMSLADLLRREEEVARLLDGSHTIIRC